MDQAPLPMLFLFSREFFRLSKGAWPQRGRLEPPLEGLRTQLCSLPTIDASKIGGAGRGPSSCGRILGDPGACGRQALHARPTAGRLGGGPRAASNVAGCAGAGAPRAVRSRFIRTPHWAPAERSQVLQGCSSHRQTCLEGGVSKTIHAANLLTSKFQRDAIVSPLLAARPKQSLPRLLEQASGPCGFHLPLGTLAGTPVELSNAHCASGSPEAPPHGVVSSGRLPLLQPRKAQGCDFNTVEPPDPA